MIVSVEVPRGLAQFKLPTAVAQRLQHLLDLQDAGQKLSRTERREAEGLVLLAESLSLLKQRAILSAHTKNGM